MSVEMNPTTGLRVDLLGTNGGVSDIAARGEH
jgi:hypothetical protein